MELAEFNKLVGQDSYVRCNGKKRMDTAIVNLGLAEAHIFSGGQIGWWVKSGYIIVDIDEGKEEALKIVREKLVVPRTPPDETAETIISELLKECDKEARDAVIEVLKREAERIHKMTGETPKWINCLVTESYNS